MSRKTITALLAALLIPTLACGFGGKDDEKDNASSNSGLGDGKSAETGTGDKAAAGGAQTFDIGKTVYYAGMKLTFGKLTYDPAREYPQAPLNIDATVENVAPTGVKGSPAFTIKTAAGTFVEGGFNNDFRTVPAGETGKTTVDFRVQNKEELGDLTAGELQVGSSESVQAIVPLGAAGELIDLAPIVLHDKPVAKKTKTGLVTYNKCTLDAASPSDHEQVEKDKRTIVCYLDMKQTVAKLAGEAVDPSNFLVRLPDGSVTAADEGPIQAFYRKKEILDTEIVFKIRWPAPGAYKVEVEFGDGKSSITLNIS